MLLCLGSRRWRSIPSACQRDEQDDHHPDQERGGHQQEGHREDRRTRTGLAAERFGGAGLGRGRPDVSAEGGRDPRSHGAGSGLRRPVDRPRRGRFGRLAAGAGRRHRRRIRRRLEPRRAGRRCRLARHARGGGWPQLRLAWHRLRRRPVQRHGFGTDGATPTAGPDRHQGRPREEPRLLRALRRAAPAELRAAIRPARLSLGAAAFLRPGPDGTGNGTPGPAGIWWPATAGPPAAVPGQGAVRPPFRRRPPPLTGSAGPVPAAVRDDSATGRLPGPAGPPGAAFARGCRSAFIGIGDGTATSFVSAGGSDSQKRLSVTKAFWQLSCWRVAFSLPGVAAAKLFVERGAHSRLVQAPRGGDKVRRAGRPR